MENNIMAFLGWFLFLSAITVCFVCVEGEVLSGTEKDEALAAHNGYRSSTTPSAANMIKLQWSDEVAANADAWVVNCDKRDNRFLNEGRPTKEKLGQNNWYGDAEEYAISPSVVVKEWMKPKDGYQFRQKRCSSPVSFRECADFTQVVMARSKFIGCAKNRCENGAKVLVTCLYEPGGNVFFRNPYKEGKPCSECPNGYACADKLCVQAEVGEGDLIERLLELL